MNSHKKKMVAPIVVTSIFVLYYVGFALACALVPVFPLGAKAAFGILPLIFAGAMITTLIKRINEIRSGEEDDLSQY